MRIGINVPNGLLDRVKQIRPEVNVSQVCREALEQNVALAVVDKLNNQLARSRHTIADCPAEPDWEGIALEDARQWVKAVNAEEWERFIENWDRYIDEGESVTRIVAYGRIVKDVKGYHDRMEEHKEWFDAQDRALVSSAANPWARANYEYCRAWLGYVSEVRRKLEQLHREEYDRVMAERASILRSRPVPEAPLQLT